MNPKGEIRGQISKWNFVLNNVIIGTTAVYTKR
jgi:hypothetical protein